MTINKIYKPSLFVALSVALVIFGFLIYNRNFNKNVNNFDYDGWKIFKDDIFDFEISYPSEVNGKIVEIANKNIYEDKKSVYFLNLITNDDFLMYPDMVMYLRIYENDGLSAAEYFKTNILLPVEDIVAEKNVKIGEVSYYQITTGVDFFITRTYFTKGDLLYELNVNKNNQDEIDIYNKIIASFKIL